jgi:hypothetical protein
MPMTVVTLAAVKTQIVMEDYNMSDLVLRNISQNLNITPEYKGMISNIESAMPNIYKNSSNFYKSDSQMKDVTLNISDLTPFTRLKHILARIERTKEALREQYISSKKKKNEIAQKRFAMLDANELEKELLEIEIEEIESNMAATENYIKGAIRQLNFLVTQYKVTMDSMGKEFITEEEYEESEAKNHIAIALKQALCAARARNGIIDEGNHIYLFELGMNGTAIQAEMYNYFEIENQMISLGQEPTHEMQIAWIEKMMEKYKDNPAKVIENRKLQMLDTTSLVRELNG